MTKLFESRFKYIILIISLIFLSFSIYYFQDHIFEIGLKPYSNMSSDWMNSEEVFVLNVNKSSRVFLLHNAKIGGGYVEFKMIGEDGQLIDRYRLSSDSFLNRNYNLHEGRYYCTIRRDVENNRESLKFYFDKRFVVQEYIR